MKILVTGATGYLGRAIAERLNRDGHLVLGAVRNDLGARTLAASGLTALRADLDDAESLRRAAAAVDAVVDAASADHSASTAVFLDALAGTGKTFIRTSGTGVYSDGAGGELREPVHTEDDGYEPLPPLQPRHALDHQVIAAATRDIHSIVIRPPLTYGAGGSLQLPVMLRAALRHGFSGYTGAGRNRYANVHIDDLAGAYALALAKAPSGSVYNVAADETDFATIAEAIGAVLGVPTRPFADDEEAHRVLGSWAVGLACNSRVDPALIRAELGWNPVGPALLDDLTAGSYRRLWSDNTLTLETTSR
jgi:nucleoside-diphosphate-sugar epimerase